MPNNRPQKVLVIGSGPIVIGQAAEFDYAGTQACKALREEGVTTVLVNSNPATIMTDEGIADVIYIEPLTVEVLERIIAAERPDGVLPTLGGQTGLNLAVDLADAGILDRYNVRLLGTPLQTIRNAEDRELFKRLLTDIAEPTPPSAIVESMDEGRRAMANIGLPLVVRPAYTLGGTGGGIAGTIEEFERIVTSGLAASPITQVLIEKSLVGWKEIEYEVMRDGADNCVTICNMENIDPMGVHTGDSIVVAPSQTLSDNDYQLLRSASLKIIRALGIEGGCNIQMALEPGNDVAETLPDVGRADSRYYIIEVNPRVSRSSALASKATGYPIARVAAKIAVGKRLDQIPNAVTQQTLAAFEPALDYCVVKIPRWPFDKFPRGDHTIGTQMKATGEVMAIDRSFEAAFQKAVRSLEITNRNLLWEDSNWRDDPSTSSEQAPANVVDGLPLHPNDDRLWALMAALRRGLSPDELSRVTGIDPWFTRAFNRLCEMENRLLAENLTPHLLWSAKRLGFGDEKIAVLTDRSHEQVRKLRGEWDIRPVYKMVDTCAAEFEAQTPYFYSTYEQENEATPIEASKAIVLGSGPIRIGQGIEFDYCSVHAAWALQEEGIRSVLANSNPETVSTDFDTSDRLYFEPLDEESIRDILENETFVNSDNDIEVPPSMVQFGGQTAINLSQSLDRARLPILGSTAQSIDTASDRHLFEEFLARVDIPNPPGAAVSSLESALNVAQEIGYPVLVRPSYVLGGRAMEIVQNATELVRYMTSALEAGIGRRVLIDRYFEGREVEVDAVCDGEIVLIPGIMEHVERAGVHSGDSMAIYPGLTLSEDEVNTIVDYTTRIGLELEVRGLMNIQYVVVGGPAYRSPGVDNGASNGKTEVYVIEVNPRSSRTIPFISKVTGVPMVKLAIKAMLGKTLKELGYEGGLWKRQKLVGVKAPVFSMSKLAGVDTYLGPEMKSTGEVMGIDTEFRPAVAKALMAAGLTVPKGGSVLLSIADRDKADSVQMIKDLDLAGCKLYASEGTADLIKGLGVHVTEVPKKLSEGHPNVLDVIMDGTIDAVVNTVTGDRDVLQDGFRIRRAAVDMRVPCFTSLDTARAAVESMSGTGVEFNVKPLPAYRNGT
ncbi:MAG: carbamoyl phosphate synthase large subunit [Chloroflexi bacterium]|jgi:carbamoyl-phosphate synthase large subunit|nr:carbamoyl phosphate synthase large subunit [Chloroflexota bacterium]MDP6662812.1 carbamoyl-phosphate synthase large subunit [SAR202 cluster bacterium]|tara:strand:+ start:757 stop:4107 length:3351 start_codon:yes stop_codon:yes gene_type:complete